MHRPTDWDEAVTDKGGEVAIPPEEEVGLRGGGETWGHTR